MSDQPSATDVRQPIPAGYWQREASHNPRPLTPMGSSLFVDGVDMSFRKVFADFGLLIEALEYQEIRGYVYNHLKPFGAPNGGAGRMPPKAVLWLALRLHPAFRKRLAVCKKARAARLDRQLIDRWFDEWRPRFITDIARLRAIDLAALTNSDLAIHLELLRTWLFEAFDVHFYLSGGNGFPLARLAFFCRDHLGYGDLQSMSLLSGLSEASSAPAVALAHLADRLRGDDTLRAALLQARPNDVPSIISRAGGTAAAQFDQYMDEYGCRAMRYEVVEPTLGETPQLVGQLLQDQLRRPSDTRAEQETLARARVAAKEEALAGLPDDGRRQEFLALLAEAEHVYPVREDNEFYTISVPFALCRFAALEAARRLVASDSIAQLDDVFFLRWDEAIAALREIGRAHV